MAWNPAGEQDNYPEYDALPFHPDIRKRSATGLWDRQGRKDHLGSLNHLTPTVRIAAAKEVQCGQSYQLDWGFHKIGTPSFNRKGLEHKVIKFEGALIHDDEVSFNTQAGSQWDGFMHQADQECGAYYNGFKHHDDVLKEEEAHSMHYWCEHGIVGRGVLLDWPRWLMDNGKQVPSPATRNEITVQDMEAIAKHQGVNFRHGDILILRVGFLAWYESVAEPERSKIISRLEFTGAKQGEDIQKWIWNNRFAAVAGDSMGFECNPPIGAGLLHNWLLPHAGIPIGELWNLEALSEACSKLNRWSFLLVSAPLNVKGGVASTPNVIAVL